ncbi:DUF1827 family protein [Enterococcus dongliensis]|uniref:DUF1827 family protein n=1 Tax=Enterococcus dongliensis TaxID=2559925 RepID=A0AAW8TIX5_9ENTE|nr:DUF1827 family protein [Enterococcus dongliensis]MDT2595571.1 DUF1827 family protein [Enterococcus dongliensis]MDT2633576.1 DUF1827 family protein [Enterococcus dongliensis]MDT2636050.1 DUF1827 family protein [Enterococcus dongliensis]MDT2643162.1 DUF1827 family protein [Enterococcus dongliensis]MDT2646382.1 DUF1827 family protein [Enterococcus dongliensis]
MKLIETPLNSNVNLETLYPNLTRYFFDKRQAVKLLKLYAYDRTKIIYVDRFDTIDLLLLNRQRKISHQEVETIIHRLLKVERKDVLVNVGYKKQILEAGLRPKESYKDIIAVEYRLPK